MTKKINILFSLAMFVSFASFAQERAAATKMMTPSTTMYPKHQWELGIHAGTTFIVGDVAPRPGYGVGLHLRRALDYPSSVRFELNYHRAYGLEPRNTGGTDGPSTTIANIASIYNFPAGDAFHANYRTTYIAGSAQFLYSLNSWNYKKRLQRYNVYGYAGVGFNAFNVKTDAKGANGAKYNFTGATQNQSDLKAILDGTYETEVNLYSPHDRPVTLGGDQIRTLQLHAQIGIGISFKINKNVNLGIDHQANILFGNNADMLDGYRLKTRSGIETQYRDVLNYTSVRLNFNLGSRKEGRTEPLYWASPIDVINDDIAELKARPKFDLTDTDGDGVIDMFDVEKESPAGCPVDTRGKLLDSDNDGVPDCKDKEPYSPPGYKVNAEGIAQVPKPSYATEGDVNRIVDGKIANIKMPTQTTTMSGGMSDWFLPMIHFDFDKSYIKRSEFEKLQHVATVMQQNPSIRVVANGNTDGPSSDSYNNNLSYNRAQESINYLVTKYGISRDRFILTYDGENKTLVNTKSKEYINRRVEFRVAKGESEMPRPDGRSGGRKFSGNKDAGF